MNDNEIERFWSKIKQEISSGLKHGFFEYELNSEIIKDKKRRLTLKAGKTHRFVINEDDVLK